MGFKLSFQSLLIACAKLNFLHLHRTLHHYITPNILLQQRRFEILIVMCFNYLCKNQQMQTYEV